MARGGTDLLPKDDAKGWKNDVPRHVYVYIVDSFLFQIQEIIESQGANYNAQDYMGDSGYSPFSVDEFNDIIAVTYVEFVTNGSGVGEEPIVYHTTERMRNRYLGWYHVFEYNGTEIMSVPIPNSQEGETEKIDKRFCSDNFWSDVCKPLEKEAGCYISLRVMVVGHLLVTKYSADLTEKGRPSDRAVKEIHQTQITPDHKVCDIFGDWKRFRENVRNMFRNDTINFLNYPSYSQICDQRKKEQHRRKVQLFEDFQLEGVNGDGVDQSLEDEISVAIRNGKLSDIILLGLRGMNSAYVSYLIQCHKEFGNRVERASRLEAQTESETTTYRSKAAKLAKEWCDPEFTLTIL